METSGISKHLLRLFSLAGFFVAVWCGGNTSPPIVDIGYAQYQGYFNATSNTTNFLGIRYAAPPTGSLRWQAPQPPAKVGGVQQANTFPPQCYQSPYGLSPTNPFLPNTTSKRDVVETTISSEDCLFLDVYTPGSSLNAKLPVLVWIHGGGYAVGNASTFYGPDVVHESDNGVVVVIIQYRLGVLGFLPGAEVKKNGALNAGLLDQNLALQWVQRNIDLFGGDSSKVTIWGESAGAGSVVQHVIAHGGKTSPPLFRAAITSSVYLPSQYNYNARIPEFLYGEVASQANCSSSSNTLACLRGVDINTLQNVQENITVAGFDGTFIFLPVVDGSFITESPTATLKKGHVNGEFYLAMGNANEGTIFVDPTLPTPHNLTLYIHELFPNLPPQLVQNASEIYSSFEGVNAAIAVMGDSIFNCPTYLMLQAFNENAHKGLFAVPPAVHGGDLAYYWPTLNGPPAYNNPAFLKAFTESFTSFAISLDPNVKIDPTNITPKWNKWSQGRTEMLFNETTAGQPLVQAFTTDPALLQRCNFWSSVSTYIGQ